MIFSDLLYDRAFELKKRKQWRRLDEDFLVGIRTRKYGDWFAVPMYDLAKDKTVGWILYGGVDGYRCMRDRIDRKKLGKMDEYEFQSMGQNHREFLISFVNMSSLKGWPDAEAVTSYCERKNLKPGGSGFFPTFRYVAPRRMHWALYDEEQGRILTVLLDALLDLDARLGKGGSLSGSFRCTWQARSMISDAAFSLLWLHEQEDGEWQLQEHCYEEHEASLTRSWPAAQLNDLEAARLKRIKKNGDSWQVEKFVYEDGIFDEDIDLLNDYRTMAPKEPGYLPDGLIMLNTSHGDVLVMNPCSLERSGTAPFVEMLGEAFKRHGRPREFQVCSQESYDFLKDVCQALDIKLVMSKHPLETLLDIRRNCIENKGELDDDALVERDPENFDDEDFDDEDFDDEDFDDEAFDDEGVPVLDRRSFMELIKPLTKGRSLRSLTLENFGIAMTMALSVPCRREMVDEVVAEFRRRVECGETMGLVLVPNENKKPAKGSRKNKRK